MLNVLFITLFLAITLMSAFGLWFLVPLLIAGLFVVAVPLLGIFAVYKEYLSAKDKNQVADPSSDVVFKGKLSDFDYLPSPLGRAPKVLIVDDDEDVAMAMEAIFKSLGCETVVATTPHDVHRMMSFNRPDFIMLDWMLGEDVTANQVVEKAVRIIDSFGSLRSDFYNDHPKVVTYSALARAEIAFPENEYFEHLEHWQKPIQLSELKNRSSEMLGSYGF